MKIFELYGYGQAKATHPAPDLDTGYSDDLKSIDRRKMNFVSYLTKLGFRKIGTGSQAFVMEHPKLSYVVKVFHNDVCYLAFVRTAMQHQDNPHFPRFIGKPIRVPFDKDFFGIRTEKLYEPDEYIEPTDADRYLTGILSGRKDARQEIAAQEIIRFYGEQFLEALNIIGKTMPHGECSGDLHSGNLMQRDDGTLVITDPVI